MNGGDPPAMNVDRTPRTVPYGYEPPVERRKGTLIVYDAFDADRGDAEAMLARAAQCAERLAFSALVLYPIHEATLSRMVKGARFEPYVLRADRLHEWKRQSDLIDCDIAVDNWEGKRRKYTPIDAALRHLTERYRPPFFLFLSADTANRFASYDGFANWMKRLRLLIADEPVELHPMLDRCRERWMTAAEALTAQKTGE